MKPPLTRRPLAILFACAAMALCFALLVVDVRNLTHHEFTIKLSDNNTMFTYQVKKYEWVPGNLLTLPDQVCGRCELGDHRSDSASCTAYLRSEGIKAIMTERRYAETRAFVKGRPFAEELLNDVSPGGEQIEKRMAIVATMDTIQVLGFFAHSDTLCICQQCFPGRKPR